MIAGQPIASAPLSALSIVGVAPANQMYLIAEEDRTLMVPPDNIRKTPEEDRTREA